MVKVNDKILEILKQSRKIAIVGLSDNPLRPSNEIARYLLHHGYKIFPVNPAYPSVLELPCHPDLHSLPESVEIVNIFRRPSEVLPIVEQAIEIKARAVWMQLGVINEAAAQRARDAGLDVVMDRCIKIEHARLIW